MTDKITEEDAEVLFGRFAPPDAHELDFETAMRFANGNIAAYENTPQGFLDRTADNFGRTIDAVARHESSVFHEAINPSRRQKLARFVTGKRVEIPKKEDEVVKYVTSPALDPVHYTKPGWDGQVERHEYNKEFRGVLFDLPDNSLVPEEDRDTTEAAWRFRRLHLAPYRLPTGAELEDNTMTDTDIFYVTKDKTSGEEDAQLMFHVRTAWDGLVDFAAYDEEGREHSEFDMEHRESVDFAAGLMVKAKEALKQHLPTEDR